MTKLKMLTLSSLVAATLVGSFALAHNGFFADGSPVGAMHKGAMSGMMAMHGDEHGAEMMAIHGSEHGAEMMAMHENGIAGMHGEEQGAEMMAMHENGMAGMHGKGGYMPLPDFGELTNKLSLNDTQQSILSTMLTTHQIMHNGQTNAYDAMDHDEMMADMPEHHAQMQAHQDLYDQLWTSFTPEQQGIWRAEMAGACHGAEY